MWNDTIQVRARLLAVSGSVVSALLLASCGGSDSDGGVASVDPAAASEASDASGDVTVTEEEMLAYTECLRDQGIEIGDPRVDANGNVGFGDIDHSRIGDPAFREQMQTAMETCGEPPGGAGHRGGPDSTEFQDTVLEFAQCMRDNGYEDFPDPDFSDEAMAGGGIFGDIDPDSPEFQEANEACADILADIGRGSASDEEG